MSDDSTTPGPTIYARTLAELLDYAREHDTKLAALEADNDRLREALETITHGPTTPGSNPETALDMARDVVFRSQEIARAALAHDAAGEKPS